MQPSAGLLFALGLSFCLTVGASPYVRRDENSLNNGYDAISLNAKFKALSTFSPCEADEVACVNNHIAHCVEGRYLLTRCDPGLVCRASPNSSGTTIDCISESKNMLLILATGANFVAVPPNDPSQSSLTLDPAVMATGFQSDGQNTITGPGQSPSRVSSNNWINFCKTVDKPLTNGQQLTTGSCNPAPIGVIPSVNNMPSAKFIFPPNFAAVTKATTFTVQLAISHLQTGWFTNAQNTFMSAPVEVNAFGDVIGHSHIVIEKLSGFSQTTPTDPKGYVFFKALNDPAVNGVLSANVTGGLPVGYYRIAAFHTGGNHQPIALPVALRGTMGDMVYFSVV